MMQRRVLVGYWICAVGFLVSCLLATGHQILGLEVLVGLPLGNIIAAIALLVLPLMVLLAAEKQTLVARVSKFAVLIALPWSLISFALAGNTALVFGVGRSVQFNVWLIYTALLVLLGLLLLLTYLLVSLKTMMCAKYRRF